MRSVELSVHSRGTFPRFTNAIYCVRMHRPGGVEQIGASAETSVIMIFLRVSPSDTLSRGGGNKHLIMYDSVTLWA